MDHRKFKMVRNKCIEVFGNPQAAEDWLISEVVALGGKTPLALIESEAGINMVMQELVRIKHGIVS